MSNHEKINYLEFPAKDMEQTKTFFGEVFDWSFVDYGPDYVACANAGIDVGFFKSDLTAETNSGSVLIVFFSDRLEETLAKVEQAKGKIMKPIFSFPGGRRFHFSDPNGNEFAVWAEPENNE
ncbi:MAG: VOC family protein [FCB group bacterium]|nr:VOC family protein [FCB group bacterium]MBL7027186.1 VOC family protein [Candidatus Neomarinimicrobiota bacterium]MBL7120579.1 VOC family protein [Candidatus Neomarinimicrobiota bacterium]